MVIRKVLFRRLPYRVQVLVCVERRCEIQAFDCFHKPAAHHRLNTDFVQILTVTSWAHGSGAESLQSMPSAGGSRQHSASEDARLSPAVTCSGASMPENFVKSFRTARCCG